MATRRAVPARQYAGLRLAAALAGIGLFAALPDNGPAAAQPQLATTAPIPVTGSPRTVDRMAPPSQQASGEAPFDKRAAFEPQAVDSAAKTDGVATPDHVPLTLEAVNDAVWHASFTSAVNATALKAQILLDRAGFSPGAIDAVSNANYRKALAAFQRENGLDASGMLDPATWDALLARSEEPVLVEYEITKVDLRGPFLPDLPEAVEAQIGLKRLAYRNPKEMLAERFHMDRRLLTALNPQAAFDEAGTHIVVARVGRPNTGTKVTRIEVDKPRHRVRAYDKDGHLVASYPASLGNDDKPTPSGAYKVRRISRFPEWRYNPHYAFKEIKTTHAFRIAAGPNNPLGTVWIGISKPSYGIHGTPVAEDVGTSFSHGCVRLTNWDVQALASMVTRRTVVEFVD